MGKICRLCHAENTNFLFRKGQLVFFRCPHCKLAFMRNTLNQQQITELYKYYAYIPQPFNPITEKRYLSLLRRFEPFKKNSRLLDIGCGGGHFISTAQNKGWKAIGTDISREAIQICKEKNLKVRCGNISELNFQSNYFDIITMFEVMEHLDNPRGTLEQIHKILRPGGLLYITTPNFNSLTRFILGPKWRAFDIEHIFYFTAVCIMRLLKQIGFSKINVKSNNLSIIEIKLTFFSHINEVKDERDKEQIFREKIENSTFLQLSKHLCNIFLNLFKLGDTLYVYAEK